MKKKKLVIFLSCEAVLLALLTVLTERVPSLFSSVLSFPLEQLAAGLRALSDAGRIGRGLAAMLWIGLSAIPAFLALRLPGGRESRGERAVLIALTPVLLFAIFGSAAPSLFCPSPAAANKEILRVVRSAFCVTVWAFVLLAVVLRLIRLFRAGSREQLTGYLRKALYALCAVFTAVGSVSLAGSILSLFREEMPLPDLLFRLLLAAAELLPCLLDIIVSLKAEALLEAAAESADAAESAAGRLERSCCLTLGLCAAVTALCDLLQLTVMRHLQNTAVTATVPVISLAFVLLLLLLARLITENRKLSDDNELFI